MAVTVRFQSTGTVPGEGRPVRMSGGSLTIGRGAENDLVLPDPDRVVSKRHCVLEERAGGVVAFDLSTNGTFLNYGKVPLGKEAALLQDGDILCIGSYELVIDLAAVIPGPPAAAPATAAPAAETGVGLPGAEEDFLDDLLGPPAAPAGHAALDRPGPGDGGEEAILPPLEEADFLSPPPAPAAPAQPQHGEAA
ncbi:FHA domain-containing protein, partial [Mangrovicoccus algicola]|uniref:FHA domain-containing protein n=1 Tax=Mangrovicoccus algicola TaxID=2771008 RepID=UPI001D030FC9